MVRREVCSLFFFFNDTATTEIYTLSLHDALPISCSTSAARGLLVLIPGVDMAPFIKPCCGRRPTYEVEEYGHGRSEEHTSELQSRQYLVCRLLLEKKK